MRCLRVVLAYDGTDFFGWQWQPDRRTVQGVLERAIERVTGESLRVIGSGRTDAGVHALGQAVSLSTQSRLDTATLARAWNANLPRDVLVLEVEEAPPGFHAIDDAIGKVYRYVLVDDPLPDIFARRYSWHVPTRLDIVAMQEAADYLVGRHDFKSFESSGSPRLCTVRTIREFVVKRMRYADGERVVIEVAADGFLYNMVRNLVGTLVAVGKGRQPAGWSRDVLAARDRRKAGATAPARGLYLVRVDFAAADSAASSGFPAV